MFIRLRNTVNKEQGKGKKFRNLTIRRKGSNKQLVLAIVSETLKIYLTTTLSPHIILFLACLTLSYILFHQPSSLCVCLTLTSSTSYIIISSSLSQSLSPNISLFISSTIRSIFDSCLFSFFFFHFGISLF